MYVMHPNCACSNLSLFVRAPWLSHLPAACAAAAVGVVFCGPPTNLKQARVRTDSFLLFSKNSSGATPVYGRAARMCWVGVGVNLLQPQDNADSEVEATESWNLGNLIEVK